MSTVGCIFLTILLLFSAFAGLGFLVSETGQQAAEIEDLGGQLAETLQGLESERTAKEEALVEIEGLKSEIQHLGLQLAKARASITQDQPIRQDDFQTTSALALGSLTVAVVGGYAVHKAFGGGRQTPPLRNRRAAEPQYTQSANPGSSNSTVVVRMTRQQLDDYIKWQRGKA